MQNLMQNQSQGGLGVVWGGKIEGKIGPKGDLGRVWGRFGGGLGRLGEAWGVAGAFRAGLGSILVDF